MTPIYGESRPTLQAAEVGERRLLLARVLVSRHAYTQKGIRFISGRPGIRANFEINLVINNN